MTATMSTVVSKQLEFRAAANVYQNQLGPIVNIAEDLKHRNDLYPHPMSELRDNYRDAREAYLTELVDYTAGVVRSNIPEATAFLFNGSLIGIKLNSGGFKPYTLAMGGRDLTREIPWSDFRLLMSPEQFVSLSEQGISLEKTSAKNVLSRV